MDIHSLLGTKLLSLPFHLLFQKRSQKYNCMDPRLDPYNLILTRYR
jgi:hypothetical protein